ncbi:hypothetical protein B0I37DRAFT_383457, partial [Chaetomium sp. MPI-CAGE-AT-0009]
KGRVLGGFLYSCWSWLTLRAFAGGGRKRGREADLAFVVHFNVGEGFMNDKRRHDDYDDDYIPQRQRWLSKYIGRGVLSR